MQSTRYEQYNNVNNHFPAVVHTSITRSNISRALQMNWHENLEIQYIISGEGYVLLNGEKINVTKGDIIIANSNVIHYIGSETKLEYSCIIIDSSFCKNAGIDHTALYFCEHIKDKETEELYKKILNIYLEKQSETKLARMQVAVLNLLIELRQNYIKQEKQNTVKRENFKIVENSIDFIHKNYNKKLTLDYIAQNIYCNKYSLSRNFKAVTSVTVVDYINFYRCTKASSLISEGMSVSAAAEKCGFNNIPFFTKTFKKYMGKLPKEYKN